ncbi:hypothetical protein FACS189421_14270 [Bacteroidia bacterium]|nr:hypothetical protein FACS189421_14270 [Bacteroidia bacterium]
MKRIYIIIVCVIGILIISISAFNYLVPQILEPALPVLMEKINLDEQNEIEILYIPGNATSQNITQIRKTNKKTKEKYVLENYERYNYLDRFSLDGENLSIVLRDTSVHHLESIETFQLNVQDVKYKLK